MLLGAGAAVAGVAVHDMTQRRHSLLRAFPVLGHGRYFVEKLGPELRQYIVAGNDDERPFSRDQRRYIYASSKGVDNYFGFGSDNDFETAEGYPIIKHRTFTGPGAATLPHAQEEIVLASAKVLGGPRGRRHAFRPGSVVNISGMSFGSLSGPAIEALNRQLRKAIKTKGHFPNEDAARKLIYLAIANAGPAWTRTRNWTAALREFTIHFGDRLPH